MHESTNWFAMVSVVLCMIGCSGVGGPLFGSGSSNGGSGGADTSVVATTTSHGDVTVTVGSGGSGGMGGAGGGVGGDAGADGNTNVCDHDPCSAGTPLDPVCNLCVATVCAVLPSLGCCKTGWTMSCAGAMEAECGVKCGDTPACAHLVCNVGGPLMDGCSLCVARVCQVQSSCCDTAWDASCVALVNQADCSVTCQ